MRIFDWGKKQREFQSVAFDRTGQLLAAGGGYQPPIVWDIATGAERIRFEIFSRGVEVHPPTDQLAIEAGEVQLGDVTTGTASPAVAADKYASLPTFAPDADWAVYQRTPEDRRSLLSAVSGFGGTTLTVLWSVNMGDTDDER